MGRFKDKIDLVRGWFADIKEDFWDPIDADTKNRIIAALHAGEAAAYVVLAEAGTNFYTGQHVDWRITLGLAGTVGFRAAKNSLRQPYRKPYNHLEQQGGSQQ